ncbi:uncharacterized protein BJ171DRAFT_535615 [Polychytrium aggregatum]|uniref:uncharacterized protein n=1 Tax=Polychytrium aggregatum TaxID=110093 RepID=UPI0022FEC1B9|nr:uncharacterized protein BJ171DRAFT_535615 [Polychytrium aggregatum]KAI9192979.1 hypothetical protein BJ171DRAFT_535615 [Polychytrium aggregatum]
MSIAKIARAADVIARLSGQAPVDHPLQSAFKSAIDLFHVLKDMYINHRGWEFMVSRTAYLLTVLSKHDADDLESMQIGDALSALYDTITHTIAFERPFDSADVYGQIKEFCHNQEEQWTIFAQHRRPGGPDLVPLNDTGLEMCLACDQTIDRTIDIARIVTAEKSEEPDVSEEPGMSEKLIDDPEDDNQSDVTEDLDIAPYEGPDATAEPTTPANNEREDGELTPVLDAPVAPPSLSEACIKAEPPVPEKERSPSPASSDSVPSEPDTPDSILDECMEFIMENFKQIPLDDHEWDRTVDDVLKLVSTGSFRATFLLGWIRYVGIGNKQDRPLAFTTWVGLLTPPINSPWRTQELSPSTRKWISFLIRWGKTAECCPETIGQCVPVDKHDGILENHHKFSRMYFECMNLASDDDVLCKFITAHCYNEGFGTAPSKRQAQSLWVSLKRNQTSAGMCCVGACFEIGAFTQKNEEQAINFYRQAIAMGSKMAEFCLGACLLSNPTRDVALLDEGMRLLQSASVSGSIIATMRLALHFERGQYVARSHANASQFYHRAAEFGSVEAQWRFGSAYTTANTDKDRAYSIEMLIKAADQGHIDSMAFLGQIYYTQSRIRDYFKAIKYLRMAAHAGHPAAQCYLSLCYLRGHGTAQSQSLHTQWLQCAIATNPSEKDKYLALIQSP